VVVVSDVAVAKAVVSVAHVGVGSGHSSLEEEDYLGLQSYGHPDFEGGMNWDPCDAE
jgi:hypothetical protein